MTKDELHQIIVEAGDKLYSDKDSHIYACSSMLIAEIMNTTENLLFEVLNNIEKSKKSKKTTTKKKK